MDKEKREAVALLRYGTIAPVLHETVDCQIKYFREMAKREFDIPLQGKRRYKPSVFKSWLKKFRKGGIKALEPKTRTDKVSSRKIGEEKRAGIKEIIDAYPGISISLIYRLAVVNGILPVSIGEQTLRKFVRDNRLKSPDTAPQPRKKFEKEAINQLWLSDFMHGPQINNQGKKMKVFLCGIIDDHSRVMTGCRFFFNENSISLELALKEAILKFGLPKVFYCDNGAVFISGHLQLACARLGIALVHSKPYDSPSRGKIERFWRTVREKFLPLLPLDQITSLDELNRLLDRWLSKEYHLSHHLGIDTRPMDKYLVGVKNTSIERVSSEELDKAFLQTIKRKVKNDSTISFKGKLYEVPPRYIGKTVEIRYAEEKDEDISIYENDTPVCQIREVNPHDNSRSPSLGIKFTKEEK